MRSLLLQLALSFHFVSLSLSHFTLDTAISLPSFGSSCLVLCFFLVTPTGIGDLFDMLLPMLVIYQEYVRNHHFSLQVLAECKQKEKFTAILRRLEEKGVLQGRTLETFLTYPMSQVSDRYSFSSRQERNMLIASAFG